MKYSSNYLKTAEKFSDKWPPDIESRGFMQIPNCLVRCRHDLSLSTSELSVLLQLCSYDFGGKKVWPAHSTLSRQSGLSMSTIRSNIVSLESKGFLHRTYRTGQSNEYNLSPIIRILKAHTCPHTLRKQTPPYQKTGRSPPRNTNTKEDVSIRLNNKSMESIKLVIGARYDKIK